MANKPEPVLWLDESRGQYIPQAFADSFVNRNASVSGVDNSTWAILEAGPEHEHYWDAWNDVVSDAIIIADDTKYFVHQDGTCWLIPCDMEWSEQHAGF